MMDGFISFINLEFLYFNYGNIFIIKIVLKRFLCYCNIKYVYIILCLVS